jgi:hypothetical protein
MSSFFPLRWGLANFFAQAGLKPKSSQYQPPVKHGMTDVHHHAQLLVVIQYQKLFALPGLEP